LVTNEEGDGYSVVLYHPGVPLPQKFKVDATRDLANLVILLERAVLQQSESLSVFLYDKTISMDGSSPPEFLSGISILVSDNKGKKDVQILPESDYASHKGGDFYFEQTVEIGGRTWIVVVVPVDNTFDADLTFIVLTGTMTFVGSIILAVWMIHSINQQIRMDKIIMRAAAEASLVSDMFPLPNVRDRIIQDARARKLGRSTEFSDDLFRDDGTGLDDLSETRLQNYMTSEGIFGSKPIAELYPYTTIMSVWIQCNGQISDAIHSNFTLLHFFFAGLPTLLDFQLGHRLEILPMCFSF
jgi:hypothetical protein